MDDPVLIVRMPRELRRVFKKLCQRGFKVITSLGNGALTLQG